MHALCIDLVYHRDCCRELRPLMQCVCTCGAVDNRSQRFGYDIVALPTSLLCSHRCYKCRDSCSLLCVGMWWRDLSEMLIKLQ